MKNKKALGLTYRNHVDCMYCTCHYDDDWR